MCISYNSLSKTLPRGIKRNKLYPSLQHRLESESQWKWNFGCKIKRECILCIFQKSSAIINEHSKAYSVPLFNLFDNMFCI